MSIQSERFKVRHVMQASDEFAHPDHTIREVAVRMRKRGIPFLPVVDGDEIVGVVEAAKIVERVLPSDASLGSKPVREVMSSNVLFCFENDDIDTAGAMARRDSHRHLIVVDDQRKLVGTVSCLALERHLQDDAPGQSRVGRQAKEYRHLVTPGRAIPKNTYGRSPYSVRPKIKD